MRRIVLAILLLAFTPQVVFAENETNQQSIHSWDNLRQLQAGKKVVIAKTDMKYVKGKFADISDNAILMRVKNTRVSVPREEVLRVTRVRKTSIARRARNSLIGMSAGVLTGFLVVEARERPTDGDTVMGVLYGSGIGAVAGAAISSPHQQTVYRAPRKPRQTAPQPAKLTPSEAEEARPSSQPEREYTKSSWGNLEQLWPGQKLVVVRTDMNYVKGKFVAFSADDIVLQQKRKQIAVPREEVVRVALREKPKRARNTRIGMGVGFLAGLAIGAELDAQHNDGPAGKILFSPTGLALGAVFGAGVPGSYRTIYRAPIKVIPQKPDTEEGPKKTKKGDPHEDEK